MIGIGGAVGVAVGTSIVSGLVVWLILSGRLARQGEKIATLQKSAEHVAELQATNLSHEKEIVGLKKDVQSEQQKSQWVEQAEQKLREAFEALSSNALRGNADEFGKQANERLKNLMDPLGKGLEKLEVQVQELEVRRRGAYESLSKQVESLVRSNTGLRDATTTLSSALRSPTARGKWGEFQLRRIAELAGMTNHIDFDEQVQTTGGKRPDMIVHIPKGGVIPVDAKVPMNAYLDAQETDTEEDLKVKLAAHARAIRAHVNELSQKAYWSQFEQAPDFVVMLIPYESGLGAAFGADPALLDDAIGNRVFIVSPVTLLALLKIMAMGWMQNELTQNAQNIAKQGKEVSDRFTTFFNHFGEIGSKLAGAVGSFNNAVGSAESRLLPAMRRLNEMGVSRDAVPDPTAIEALPRQIALWDSPTADPPDEE